MVKKKKVIDPKKVKFKTEPVIKRKWYYKLVKIKFVQKIIKSKLYKKVFRNEWRKRLIQKQWYQKIVQIYLPMIKNYFNKGFIVFLWGGVYLFFLRLFNFRMTWMNLGSAIALYFILEEVKGYLLNFRGKKR